MKFGEHTLTATAGLQPGSRCYSQQMTDNRTFIVNEFEQFENEAIEMDPPEIRIAYSVPDHGNYFTHIGQGEQLTIYPGGRDVTFSYRLKNTTERNYQFHICLFHVNYTCRGEELLTFHGPESIDIVQRVNLSSSGSGFLRVEATDILIEPIGNDVRPIYFSGQLNVVNNVCPADKQCCSYRPDGSCASCQPICP